MAPPAFPAPVAASQVANHAAVIKQTRRTAAAPLQHQSINQQPTTEEEPLAHLSMKELLQQLQLTVEDLSALDASLSSLFQGAPNTEVTEHLQLVQVGDNDRFRSRVARRISRYGQLTKGLTQLVEKALSFTFASCCCAAQSPEGPRQREGFSPRQLHELEGLLKQHQQRLQKYVAQGVDFFVCGFKQAEIVQYFLEGHPLLLCGVCLCASTCLYKSQFAAWWQNTERHFHTMRMANYVCSVQERQRVSMRRRSAQLATGTGVVREGPTGGPLRAGGPRAEPAGLPMAVRAELHIRVGAPSGPRGAPNGPLGVSWEPEGPAVV
ncbi:hypothetical protein cyc_02129 [Cyclospora cayetanensis]|uniref:Uncharacterized protein n=1 Tax=Cyclospora cayetanensis TaxID=88456 RepID=A0A1D3CWR9_9EIME|nr:hypothetical protein cyc_02129 [Cyclospora cayetanensis]